MKTRNLLTTLAAIVVSGGLALAANTTFVTNLGDLVFPFSPPTRAGAAGTIDNMTIGATTPRAGTFTSVTNTGGGALTADSITGTDSSLGITGQAAAQGGAVASVGGASSTSGNAGGAVTAVGGAPGATGVGGAVSMTGGVGGSTSGAGGAASVTGGAGTLNAIGGAASVAGGAGQGTGAGAVASLTGGASGGGATGNGGLARVVGGAATSTAGDGGAAQLTGGLGTTTGAGGAITITGGAAGSTGAPGAVNISAGAATANTGGSVTITATAGVGTTNGGGSVNLVPGAAASTGAPGTVQVNGNANLMCASFVMYGAPAAATDTAFYIATRPLLVVTVSESHAVAAGGTSKLNLMKDTGTTAPGGGAGLLTNNSNAGFDLAATANTVQTGTLTATVATKTLAAGDRLSVHFSAAIQSTSGATVTACMAPL